MPKYRRRSTYVEANQFQHPATAPLGVYTEEDGRAYVVTSHLVLPEADRIHFYPVKDDVFKKTYEEVE